MPGGVCVKTRDDNREFGKLFGLRRQQRPS
jgi:hypothetical protein